MRNSRNARNVAKTTSGAPKAAPKDVSKAVPKAASKGTSAAPVLGTRALNRATLARQLLLARSPVSAKDALTHLLGLQAQNVKPPYYALAARLDGFDPEELSRLMADREAVRIVTMRSTIHTHTADDCLTLRPLVQPARDRELAYFRKGLEGVDLDRLTALARELVETEPRTMKQLREALLVEWPDADPQSLSVAARCRLPLVQVTPRGLWGRSGQVALTTAEHWLGRQTEGTPAKGAPAKGTLAEAAPAEGGPAQGAPAEGGPAQGAPVKGVPATGRPAKGAPAQGAPAKGTLAEAAPAEGAPAKATPTEGALAEEALAQGVPAKSPPAQKILAQETSTLDATVLRYLAAFGPASVKDMQTWAGLTRLRDAFERLRPQLLTFRDERGTELFDLPDAPRPDPDAPAPPRFLPEFDNLLLSHADRTRLVPADLKGRTWTGNQAHCVLLVDGFLAGLWRLTDDTLTVEPFGTLTKGQRAAVVEEGERMLGALHGGTAYDIRFGTVVRA